MSDLILEFYSEEIPSRMQKKASIDLKDIFSISFPSTSTTNMYITYITDTYS